MKQFRSINSEVPSPGEGNLDLRHRLSSRLGHTYGAITSGRMIPCPLSNMRAHECSYNLANFHYSSKIYQYGLRLYAKSQLTDFGGFATFASKDEPTDIHNLCAPCFPC